MCMHFYRRREVRRLEGRKKKKKVLNQIRSTLVRDRATNIPNFSEAWRQRSPRCTRLPHRAKKCTARARNKHALQIYNDGASIRGGDCSYIMNGSCN